MPQNIIVGGGLEDGEDSRERAEGHAIGFWRAYELELAPRQVVVVDLGLKRRRLCRGLDISA